MDATILKDTQTSLPIIPGRAAAGVPFDGSVPKGSALRVLTGAPIPDGVTCVALDEDVTVDLVIVEGFKSEPHAKIECHRAATGQDLISKTDTSIVALASDTLAEAPIPTFPLDDTAAIAAFIRGHVGLT